MAVGCPWTEMPNSVSVPITRRTLMARAYAAALRRMSVEHGRRSSPSSTGRRRRSSARPTRSVVRRDNLLHAATAVLVRDPDGPDLRPPALARQGLGAVAPRRGGRRHPAARRGARRRRPPGSSPRSSASPARPCGRWARRSTRTTPTRCVEHCFETTWDGLVTHADGEVVWGAWMTLPELGAHCWRTRPGRSCRTPVPCCDRLGRDGVGDYAALTSLTVTHERRQRSPGGRGRRAARPGAHGDPRTARSGSLEEAAAARGVEPRTRS